MYTCMFLCFLNKIHHVRTELHWWLVFPDLQFRIIMIQQGSPPIMSPSKPSSGTKTRSAKANRGAPTPVKGNQSTEEESSGTTTVAGKEEGVWSAVTASGMDLERFLPLSLPGWRGIVVLLRAGGWLVGRLAGQLVPDLQECISVKPMDRFNPFEVLMNCLDLKLCNVMVKCPFARYELAHGEKTCQIWYLLGPDFEEFISLKPLDGFTPFKVLWNCLDL